MSTILRTALSNALRQHKPQLGQPEFRGLKMWTATASSFTNILGDDDNPPCQKSLHELIIQGSPEEYDGIQLTMIMETIKGGKKKGKNSYDVTLATIVVPKEHFTTSEASPTPFQKVNADITYRTVETGSKTRVRFLLQTLD
ncbi:hypothetical protein FQN50_009372 [Emmonsiellopsis sp. PD_5]|nr:hypothetical protein FQN50_009372 [Emmonsiellopsis sp. PD_5]